MKHYEAIQTAKINFYKHRSLNNKSHTEIGQPN